MQDAEKADGRAQVLRIGGDLKQGGGAGLEQESKENSFVLPDQRRQSVRNTENKMIVADGKQFALPGAEPLLAGIRLAFWTVTVTAGAIRDGFITAASALIAMPAECSGSATCDRGEYFKLSPAQRLTIVLDESASCFTDDIGHLEGWLFHGCLSVPGVVSP